MFTIPWLFEALYEEVIELIPKDIGIIEWDYNLDRSRIESLSARIQMYKHSGHQLIFMPTGGFSFDIHGCLDAQVKSVYLQLQIAISSKVSGIVHFLGPHMTPHLTEVSVKKLLESVGWAEKPSITFNNSS